MLILKRKGSDALPTPCCRRTSQKGALGWQAAIKAAGITGLQAPSAMPCRLVEILDFVAMPIPLYCGLMELPVSVDCPFLRGGRIGIAEP